MSLFFIGIEGEEEHRFTGVGLVGNEPALQQSLPAVRKMAAQGFGW